MKRLTRKLAIIVLASFFVTSCSLSTDDLAKEVVKSIKQTDQFQASSITINSLILTKKSGNEYTGVLETSEPDGEYNYKVEVIYDGQNMTWQILD